MEPQSHLFEVEIARQYGVNAAIFLEHLRFWIHRNIANKSEEHFRDGRWWTWNSASALSKIFPYWTPRQIRTIIEKLEAGGVIVTEKLGGNNRATWYAFGPKNPFDQNVKWNESHLTKMSNENTKMSNPFDQNVECIQGTVGKPVKRGGDSATPEDVARITYLNAKKTNNGLSPNFLDWFEREVLGRWDKYKVNDVILDDWYERLWCRYDPELLTTAVASHRADHDLWAPKFAAVVGAARKLRTKEAVKLRAAEKQSEQKTRIADALEPQTEYFAGLSTEAALERLRIGSMFEREQIRKKRPELVALAAAQ